MSATLMAAPRDAMAVGDGVGGRSGVFGALILRFRCSPGLPFSCHSREQPMLSRISEKGAEILYIVCLEKMSRLPCPLS
jgi:hypothetical protein